MVVVDKSLEKMMENIDFTKGIYFDYIIPSEYPYCPPANSWIPFPRYETIPDSLEECPKNSDLWGQFMDEKYEDRFDEILRRLINIGYLYGNTARPLMGLALENAFCHGNKNNPDLPVSLKVFEGKKGLIVRIRDSGIGFDFKKTAEAAKKLHEKDWGFWLEPQNVKEEDRYFLRKGMGFLDYVTFKPEVSFENNGTTINLMFPSLSSTSE